MIQQTTNYEIFKSLTYNREVDKSHVNRLVKSIQKKDLLHLNPIIVTKEFEVIDGQHRLEAAKQLNIPIWYLIDDQDFDGSEIQQLNSVQKNWKPSDYLAYWCIKKAPGFGILNKFVNQNPAIPLTSARSLMSSTGESRATDFANGKIDVSNIKYAEELADQLKDYRNKGYQFVYSSKFINALMKVNEAEGYDHNEMMRKIDIQPRAFVQCANLKQYLQMFEEIYNYHSKSKTRFL